MTQEQKAKAYDKAVKEASIAYKDEDRHLRATLERIFPELCESKDERIKKELIDFVKSRLAGFPECGRFIAWLEKQCEKPQGKSALELKFHEGQWITIDKPCQIISINDNENYIIRYCDDEQIHVLSKDFCESHFHLWTIQDAKDGDVLSFYGEYKGNKMIQVGIIEKYVGKYGGCSNSFKIYVGVNWENNLQIGKYMGCSDIRPATKEQRDALFAKMGEAGYEWNAEKKELKKIDNAKVNDEDYELCGLNPLKKE